MTDLRKTVPPNVAAAVAKALEKLPADRFASAKEFATRAGGSIIRRWRSESASGPGRQWTRARVAGVIVGVVTALLAGVLLGRSGRASAQRAPFTVSEILPPDGEDLSDRRSFGALSPDGRTIAMVLVSSTGQRKLWLRRLDGLAAEPLPGTEHAESPFWSPDGRSLGFFADGRLMRIDLGASAPRRICGAVGATSGSWGEGDLIVFATPRGIERVGARGCEVVLPLDSAAVNYRTPSLVGDGTHGYFFTRRATSDVDNGAYGGSIMLGDLKSGEARRWWFRRRSVPRSCPRTASSTGGVCRADLRSSGSASPGTAPGSRVNRLRSPASFGTPTSRSYSASPSGSLVYLPSLGNREKLLVDRSGAVVDTLRQRGTWTFSAARAHPWVAMAASWALWLYDFDRGVSTPLVQGEGKLLVANPVWSPGDTALAFGACQLASIETVARSTRLPVDDCVRATDWSPDGRHLVLEVGESGSVSYYAARTVVAYDFEQGSTVPLFDVTGPTSEASVSPDGALIAYTSWDTGGPEISPSAVSGRRGAPYE